MHENKNNKKNKNNKILAKNQRDKIKSQLKVVKAHIDKGVFVFSKEITIAEFANTINYPVTEIIKYFFNKGLMLNQNTLLKEEQLGELSLELGIDFKKEKSLTHENILEDFEINDEESSLLSRSPIVTIMGHVDHGKTTLLDTIRQSNVVGGEHGGITQHIGAYKVETASGSKITFLDTPGHEAFTQMRARGSSITDIVVLVVAADDGVKAQTKEAIDHAKAADVPIIVFVNKIDKPGANKDNVMMQLSQEELTPEEWGGKTPFIYGSAKLNQGIDELLDVIFLLAEINNLRANPNRFAYGTVIESHLDKGVGPIATLLVQSGTLKIKDALVVGSTFGYVRDMLNEYNQKLTSVGPSTPVKVHGLHDIPNAGDKFMVFRDEKLAREIAESRKKNEILNNRFHHQNFSLESLSEQIKSGQLKQINIILKADSNGSVEALKASLQKITVEGVKINVIRSSTGGISESDLTLALASQAIVIGFNVRPSIQIRKKADDEKIKILLHTIIYKVIEEIESIAKGILDPIIEEVVLGHAEVRKLFYHSNIGTIAGCYVLSGTITRKDKVRVLRNDVIIYNGDLSSLKNAKNDIKESREGSECGLTVKNFNDIKEQDVIESYEEKVVS